MNRNIVHSIVLIPLMIFAIAPVTLRGESPPNDALPDNDVVMRALVDELSRSMSLQMEDLEKPYFIQYAVQDAVTYELNASYGALTSSKRDRSRTLYTDVRVGSYELDNTNFADGGFGFGFGGGSRGGGGRAMLPIDDDYTAIRQAVWWQTDNMYKTAVETLTKKRAYMEDKKLDDRPDDFVKLDPVEHVDPSAELVFDKKAWEAKLKRISAYFEKHPQIQDSSVQLLAGASNDFVVNSEGSRVRTGDTGVLLIVTAEMQAEDGMRISDSRSYAEERINKLPAVEKVLADLDEMIVNMSSVAKAPMLESYTGPVLFDGMAAGQVFREMLAGGVAGSVNPVGTQRRSFQGSENLEKKIGQRILPRSFNIYDDPNIKTFGDTYLFGHFEYDDEGIKAKRVDIVVDGKLKNMALSRVPTKKLSGSNGHGRRPMGGGSATAAIGNLFIEDEDAVSSDELKQELIDAAKDEGLEYAIRVKSVRSTSLGSSQNDIMAFFMNMQRGRSGGIGDPVYAYKVYVDDGREELIRGVEFGSVTTRALKRILASGKDRTVYNYIGIGFGGATPPTSIIAPPVLFEELELSRIEQEQDNLPLMENPIARKKKS